MARPLATAIVLCAASCLATSARAQHCGSYVAGADDHLLRMALGLSAVAEPGAAPASDAPPPAVPPCRGPSCSRAPAAPTPSPAPPAPPSVEHWALVDLDPGLDEAASTPLPSSDPSLRPALAVDGVFHPPRAR